MGSVRTFFETRVTLVANDQNIIAAYSEVKREILRRIRHKPADFVPRCLGNWGIRDSRLS